MNGWLRDGVSNAIWGIVLDFIGDIMNKAFGMISDLILQASNINAYFNVTPFLTGIQAIAGSLLVLAVVWEGVKQLSGKVIPGSEKSLGTLAGQTLLGGTLIFFLPWSVTNVFLALNNALVGFIKSVGVDFDFSKIANVMQLTGDPIALGGLVIILMLVLAIGFLGIGIAAGIRFIELVIVILISPIVAVSAVKSSEAIHVWVRETVAIVFTQSIQLICLKILLVVMINVQGVMQFILCIGCIAVALKGPQVLRQFLYSSGTGSAAVGAVGAGGRMAAMKMMFKAIK